MVRSVHVNTAALVAGAYSVELANADGSDMMFTSGKTSIDVALRGTTMGTTCNNSELQYTPDDGANWYPLAGCTALGVASLPAVCPVQWGTRVRYYYNGTAPDFWLDFCPGRA